MMAPEKSVSTVGGLMVVGIGAGSALGAAMENIPVGMAIGLALGLVIGFGIDMNRRKQDNDNQ